MPKARRKVEHIPAPAEVSQTRPMSLEYLEEDHRAPSKHSRSQCLQSLR